MIQENDSSQDESESYNSNRDEQESSDDDCSASSEGSYQSQHSSNPDEFNDSE
jgi:hypothetical protein